MTKRQKFSDLCVIVEIKLLAAAEEFVAAEKQRVTAHNQAVHLAVNELKTTLVADYTTLARSQYSIPPDAEAAVQEITESRIVLKFTIPGTGIARTFGVNDYAATVTYMYVESPFATLYRTMGRPLRAPEVDKYALRQRADRIAADLYLSDETTMQAAIATGIERFLATLQATPAYLTP